MLNTLTHINADGTRNDLFIGVNQEAAITDDTWVISGDADGSAGISTSGLVKDANAENVMDGYTAYTNADGDIHVYIQQEIALITGG
jgi:hypothetical protein